MKVLVEVGFDRSVVECGSRGLVEDCCWVEVHDGETTGAFWYNAQEDTHTLYGDPELAEKAMHWYYDNQQRRLLDGEVPQQHRVTPCLDAWAHGVRLTEEEYAELAVFVEFKL